MSSSPQATVLATAAVRGALWSFLTTLAVRLVSLASLAVLTRLLLPEEFGLMALGLVFVTYAETVGDLGTGAALIYWPRRRADAALVTFWIGLAMGLFWFTVTQLAAGPLAAFFHQPAAEPLLRVLALTFPLRALGRTHDALCQKGLRFRSRLLPEATMFVAKGLVAIGLALSGLGVWSLVWGQLAGEALRTASFWLVVPWRPSLTLPVDLVGPVLRYGRGIIAVNLLAAVLHHADLVIVGRRLGAEALGLYQIAGKIPEITVALLVWGGARVLFPTLAKVQDCRTQLREVYLEALRWVAVLALPATVGLILLAEPLLVTSFGETWRPAVPILQALAVYTGLRALGSHTGDVLKATGRSQLLAGLGLVKAVVLLPTLVWASSLGAPAVAWSLAAVGAFGLLLNLSVVAILLGLSLGRLADSLKTSVPVVLVALLWLVVWIELAADLPAMMILAGGGAVGLISAILTLRWSSPTRFRQAVEHLFRRRPADSRASEIGTLNPEAS